MNGDQGMLRLGSVHSLACIRWERHEGRGVHRGAWLTDEKNSSRNDRVGQLAQGPENGLKPQQSLQAEDRAQLPKLPPQSPN